MAHIVIGVGQVEPVFGDVPTNIRTTTEVIEKAASSGANLVVLPELVSSGYMMGSREEAYDLAETPGGGLATSAWKELGHVS